MPDYIYSYDFQQFVDLGTSSIEGADRETFQTDPEGRLQVAEANYLGKFLKFAKQKGKIDPATFAKVSGKYSKQAQQAVEPTETGNSYQSVDRFYTANTVDTVDAEERHYFYYQEVGEGIKEIALFGDAANLALCSAIQEAIKQAATKPFDENKTSIPVEYPRDSGTIFYIEPMVSIKAKIQSDQGHLEKVEVVKHSQLFHGTLSIEDGVFERKNNRAQLEFVIALLTLIAGGGVGVGLGAGVGALLGFTIGALMVPIPGAAIAGATIGAAVGASLVAAFVLARIGAAYIAERNARKKVHPQDLKEENKAEIGVEPEKTASNVLGSAQENRLSASVPITTQFDKRNEPEVAPEQVDQKPSSPPTRPRRHTR